MHGQNHIKCVQNLFSEDRACECTGFTRLSALKVKSESTKDQKPDSLAKYQHVRTLHRTSRASKW